MPASAEREPGAQVAVWDWPVRITHWALVVLFALQWWSGKAGKLDLHTKFGMMFVGLLAFRILWGLFGSSTARFARFVGGPRAVWTYAAGLFKPAEGAAMIGHNPMGGWSIVAMLALLTLQVGFGLFAVDTDGLESGPLAYKVSFDQGRWAAHAHGLVFNLLLALTALHVAAAVFYLVQRRENLIGPMLTGRRRAPAGTAPMARVGWWRVLLALALAYAVMSLVWFHPF